MNPLNIIRIPGEFAICELAPESAIPAWVTGPFTSVSRAEDELSIVCLADTVPDHVKSDGGWSCLKLAGPFEFDQVGIIAGLTGVLAQAKIGVFVVSTFRTDFVLVKKSNFLDATRVLEENGYEFSR